MLLPDEEAFIKLMLDTDVLRFGEFITKSGRKTPYFINTGNYYTGLQIAMLGSIYAREISHHIGADFDAMFGPAYKGIPLVATAAGTLKSACGIDKPYFFNRKEIKDHGEGGSIIGYHPKDHDRIIIIEDVITAGTAVREMMPLLKSLADVDVVEMYVTVDRCEMGQTPGKTAVMEISEEFGIDVHSFVTIKHIREYLSTREEYAKYMPMMDDYMEKYCVL